MLLSSLPPPKPEGIPSWEWLSSFRSTAILKVGYLGSIVTPLVASFIVSYNSGIEWLNSLLLKFGAPALSPIELPLNLILLFSGSLSLALGHILNELACPYVIKKYGSLEEYRSSVASYIHDQSTIYSAALESNKAHFKKEIMDKLSGDDEISAILSSKMAEVCSEENEQHKAQEAVADETLENYDAYWKRLSNSFIVMRYTILSLYVIAAIISLTLVGRQIFLIFSAI